MHRQGARPVTAVQAAAAGRASTASIRSRIAIAYAAPLGLRTLSSSTRQPPNSLRTRSKPMIGARTVPLGSRVASAASPESPRPARG